MIKSIAFDLGGVLLSDWRDILYTHIEKTTGVPRKEFMEKFSHGSDEVHAGTLDAAVYWRGVLGPAVDKHSDETLRDILVKPYQIRIDKEVFAIAQSLKKEYGVGIISNTLAEHTAYTRKHCPGFLELFDPVVLSWEVQITKPDRRIFEHYLRLANVKAEETVFIDDAEKTFPEAQKLGIHCLLYKNPDQLVSDLQKLGVRL